MPSQAAKDAYRLREVGLARNGTVDIRDFDQGVIETLGSVLCDDNYYLPVAGVDPPPHDPPYPGIPVTFSFPEDTLEEYRVPMLLVRRESLDPAMNRWQPDGLQYRVPAYGASPKVVQTPAGTKKGWDRYESAEQAIPYDILYTLQIMARYRGGAGSLASANRILHHVMKVYPPYSRVLVKDSIGDVRSYSVFSEGVSPLDEVEGVSQRMIGFAVTMRVEAEIDLADPEVGPAVTALPTIRTHRR